MNAATPDFELADELTCPRCWQWRVACFKDGHVTHFTLTLSFLDHDRWCRGSLPPAELAAKVLRLAMQSEHFPESLPKRLDCARLTHRIPGLAAQLSL